MSNFWKTLPKPFFAVAPMADVTDAPFRRMIAKYSAWHERNNVVMWTEFVSADGLLRATSEGKKKLMADLLYSEVERPIVAQLFSSNEDHMEKAAALCLELGFDGVDINMGCPDRSIEKQGCGAAMIQTPELAARIIQAAKRGSKSGREEGIPVSVKTRLGYNEDTMEEWLSVLLAQEPDVLTLHGRTRKQMSRVPANWDRIADAVALRDRLGSTTLIIGNGDVLSPEDAQQKAHTSGVDGVMIGRALFGNPWFFHPTKRVPLTLLSLPTKGVQREDIVLPDASDTRYTYVTVEEKLQVMLEHTRLFEELLPFKSFAVMKKHYKAYVNGFPGAVELRKKLMEAQSATEVEDYVCDFLHDSQR